MSRLSSDAANIASFSAALDHPDLFIKDPLLSDPGNFRFYFTIHVPAIRLLNDVFGNYGTAFASLLFPVLLLQLLGFYYLGNALYLNRFWAFLLSVVTAVPVTLNLAEVWGFYLDALPRIVFQALLPFLLGTAIKRGGRLESWPWIMGGAGLLVYVHPVSAPAWGVAILIGLWFSAPFTPVTHRFKKAVLSLLVFSLVAAPFALNYLANFAHSQTKNYDQVMEILAYRFAPGFLDLSLALHEFYQVCMNSSWINRFLWIFAGVGFLVAAGVQWRDSDQKRRPCVLASWWGGLLLISVVVPLVEHGILKALHRTPLEFDLIRGLRYTIPLVWMTAFWVLSEVYNVFLQRSAGERLFGGGLWAGLVMVVGVGMAAAWANQNQLIAQTNISAAYTCWTRGMFICPRPEEAGRTNLFDAIHTLTPPGSSIFYSDLAVRYYSLRSITYTNKDGGALGYANHNALIRWYEQNQEIAAIDRNAKNKPLVLDAYVEFARKYDADFYVILYDTDYLAFRNDTIGHLAFGEEDNMIYENSSRVKLLYRNSYGSLYEIMD